MQELWSTELTEEETENLLQKAAKEIRRRKLETPAILFFEMHKPLAFVGSQAAIVFSPFLIPLFGFNKFNDYSRLFSKRENFERFIRLLEGTTPNGEEKVKDSIAGTANESKAEPGSGVGI